MDVIISQFAISAIPIIGNNIGFIMVFNIHKDVNGCNYIPICYFGYSYYWELKYRIYNGIYIIRYI